MRARFTKLMSGLTRGLFYTLLCTLTIILSSEADARGYSIPTSPGPDFDIGSVLSNYTSAGGGELYLKPLDNNLMGESYDVDTGSISFRQTDVSIPGNSSLSVQFSRRASGKSYIQYNAPVMTPLGSVWDIDLPYVITRVARNATSNCNIVTPNNGYGSSIFSIGIKLYTPGGGELVALKCAPQMVRLTSLIGRGDTQAPFGGESLGTKMGLKLVNWITFLYFRVKFQICTGTG